MSLVKFKHYVFEKGFERSDGTTQDGYCVPLYDIELDSDDIIAHDYVGVSMVSWYKVDVPVPLIGKLFGIYKQRNGVLSIRSKLLNRYTVCVNNIVFTVDTDTSIPLPTTINSDNSKE